MDAMSHVVGCGSRYPEVTVALLDVWNVEYTRFAGQAAKASSGIRQICVSEALRRWDGIRTQGFVGWK